MPHPAPRALNGPQPSEHEHGPNGNPPAIGSGNGAAPGLVAGAGAHFKGGAEVLGFTITDNAVTAMSMTLRNNKVVNLPLPKETTFAVVDGDVVATRTLANSVSKVVYGDSDSDGLYQVVGASTVITAAPDSVGRYTHAETLAVTLTGTTVAGVTEMHGTEAGRVLLSDTVKPDGVTWALDSGLLVETRESKVGTRWEVFRDGNADGVYTKVAFGFGVDIDIVGITSLTDALSSSL